MDFNPVAIGNGLSFTASLLSINYAATPVELELNDEIISEVAGFGRSAALVIVAMTTPSLDGIGPLRQPLHDVTSHQLPPTRRHDNRHPL